MRSADVVDDSTLLYQQFGIHQRGEKLEVLRFILRSAVEWL